MIIYKNYAGFWIIEDLINGYLIKRVYAGYNKSNSIKLFKNYTYKLKGGFKK